MKPVDSTTRSLSFRHVAGLRVEGAKAPRLLKPAPALRHLPPLTLPCRPAALAVRKGVGCPAPGASGARLQGILLGLAIRIRSIAAWPASRHD